MSLFDLAIVVLFVNASFFIKEIEIDKKLVLGGIGRKKECIVSKGLIRYLTKNKFLSYARI